MDQANSAERKVLLVARHSVEASVHPGRGTGMQLALQSAMAKAQAHLTAEVGLVGETRSPAMDLVPVR
jgi:hypothetical protein